MGETVLNSIISISSQWRLPAILPIVYFALNINSPICVLAFWKAGGIIKTCTNTNNFPKNSNGYLVIN